MNGPDEGEIISRVKGDMTLKVRIGEKHYTNNSPIPFMCEVFVSREFENPLHNDYIDEPLWVVLEINEITNEKFLFHTEDHTYELLGESGYDDYYLYSLQPQFLIGRMKSMNLPRNVISTIFSVVTGISVHYPIIMDRA